MKKTKEPGLDDILRLGESALEILKGAWNEAQCGEKIARKLHLVTREEFDAAFAMIKKARAEQLDIEKRLERLEKPLNAKGSVKNKPNKKKTSRR